MKKNSAESFWKKPAGKLGIAAAAMVAGWIFLLWNLSGSFGSLFLSEERVASMRSDISKLEKENGKLSERLNLVDDLKKRSALMQAGYWNENRDGDVENTLRERLHECANTTDLKLNSLGSVRLAKINAMLYYAEIDLQCSVEIAVLCRFLGAVERLRPQVSWKRLEIRRERMRPGAGETTSPLAVSGTVRVICFDESAKGGAQ